MAERDGFERSGRGHDAHEALKALMRQRAIDCPQPIGTLRMAGWREVMQAGGVGNEKRGHHTIRSGVGAGYSRSVWRRPKAAHSHLCPVTLTPGGGASSSGTKKVGASGSPASTRYFSKLVTPSAARKVSSIRKLPVKLREGLWNTRYAASAMISGVRDMRITRSPPSRFLIAAVAMVVRGHSAFTAMPLSRSSPASPSTTRLMPYLAIE